VARELATPSEPRDQPEMIVSNNGIGFASNAMRTGLPVMPFPVAQLSRDDPSSSAVTRWLLPFDGRPDPAVGDLIYDQLTMMLYPIFTIELARLRLEP
jgi:hypothetical protein